MAESRTTVAWPALEAGMNTLLARIATPPGGVAPSVVGANQGQIGFRSPSNPTELSWQIESVAGVGRDELRRTYLPGTYDAAEDETPTEIEGDTYVPDPEQPDLRLGGVEYAQNGQRRWVLEVRLESNEQSAPASAHARALVGRLRLPSTSDELAALGLAYATWDEVLDDTYDDEHGRAVSVYILRLFLNGAEVYADTPVTTIETSERTVNVVP